MRRKIFKDLNQQISILKAKGLVINNEEDTKETLLRENYFFLMGYRHLFYQSKTHRRFISGTTFHELYALFLFDRDFRNIIFKNLLIVENNIKSIISYQLSKKYGYKEKDYLKPQNFSNEVYKIRQVNDVLYKMKRQIRVNSKKHSATLHYMDKYGYIPLWILVKVLSFGIIGELYSILKTEDQLAIAQFYNLDINTLEDYLVILSNYRNLCAHEDILYENKTQLAINDSRYHLELKISIEEEEYKYGKYDLFALIIIMKSMLKPNEFSILVEEINRKLELLNKNIRVIPLSKILDRMGFPNNWIDIAKIK